MSLYTCERCGEQDHTGWTDYYVRLEMGVPVLCARCDPHQRCYFHHEAAQQSVMPGVRPVRTRKPRKHK
jgi:hypothetical protein